MRTHILRIPAARVSHSKKRLAARQLEGDDIVRGGGAEHLSINIGPAPGDVLTDTTVGGVSVPITFTRTQIFPVPTDTTIPDAPQEPTPQSTVTVIKTVGPAPPTSTGPAPSTSTVIVVVPPSPPPSSQSNSATEVQSSSSSAPDQPQGSATLAPAPIPTNTEETATNVSSESSVSESAATSTTETPVTQVSSAIPSSSVTPDATTPVKNNGGSATMAPMMSEVAPASSPSISIKPLGGAAKPINPAFIAIPVVITVLILGALAVLLIRRRFIRNRKRKRQTWGADAYPQMGFERAEAALFTARNGPAPGFSYVSGTDPAPAPAPYNPPQALAQPSMTYNNPMAPAPVSVPVPAPGSNYAGSVYSGISGASSFVVGGYATLGGAGAGAGTGAAAGGGAATVRCTFIPSLPDELQIASGERVRVLADYDDGWALCENGRAEQGMVPLECLDVAATAGAKAAGDQLAVPTADYGTNNIARRASSLMGAGSTGYRY